MRAKKKQAIGLSIGQSKIALAEAELDPEGAVRVSYSGVADTPEGAVENGRITNPAAVAQAIRGMLSSSNLDAVKEVSLAIPDEGSVTRLQTLPSMSRTEALEALRGEVENYAVLAGGEPLIDFQVTKGSPDAAGQQMEVLYVATTEELVSSYLTTMEAANLKASSIEIKPLAILRAYTNFLSQTNEGDLPEADSDKPLVIAVIEENLGIIIIARKENIDFIHDIEIGSDNLQNDNGIRELSRELRSSVDYYQNTLSPGEKIEHVILFSDNEALTDIAERIKELLRLSVSAYSLSELAAAGAAMREVKKEAGTTINFLLTSRGSEVVSLRKRVVMLLVVALSAVLLALGARFLLQMQAESVEAELISLQERQAISEAQALQHIPLLQAGVSSLKAQIEVTNAAMNSITWGDQAKLMEEIRRVIPRNVWLINLRWSGSTVNFEGFGLTWQDAFDFRTALLDYSPYFSSVAIGYIRDVEIGNREVARFQFQCGIRRDLLGRGVKQE